jgi:SNF2 family DNA or RNA helicase
MVKLIKNVNEDTLENFLHNEIRVGDEVDITAAKTSVYAFYALRNEIKHSKKFRVLLTTASKNYQNEQNYRRRFELSQSDTNVYGGKYEIKLRNRLDTAYMAHEILKTIKNKLEVRELESDDEEQSQLVIKSKSGNSDSYVTNFRNFDAADLGIIDSKKTMPKIALSGIEAKESVDITSGVFEELWGSNSKDVTSNVIERIKKIYSENSPEWIYYVSLYHIFHDQLGEFDEDAVIREGTGFHETKIWNTLYQFQKDGVIGLIEKLERYNGAILADSVGLGKTYSALAVIKYYELRNDKVLVLTPKRLRDNWTIYTTNDIRNNLVEDRFNYDVLNHTDLSRHMGKSGEIDLKTLNWGNYDLIVIDESHNFRNNDAKKSNNLTRYQRLMQDVIKAGVKTKVLMLSATPVNNRMTDIKNQIAFITQDNSHALAQYGIGDIDEELRQAQAIFNDWTKLGQSKRTTQQFLDMVNPGYFKILDLLTIARSRKHIQKYYGNQDIGEFPKRLLPINKKSDIDIEGNFLSLQDVNDRINMLNLALYTPMAYIMPKKRKKYQELYDTSVKGGKTNFSQQDRETALTGLIRVNLLKRMESSINSFQITLKKIIDNIEFNLDKIQSQSSLETPVQSIDDFDDDEEFEEFFDDDQMIGKKVHILLGDMDLLKWSEALKEDLQSLKVIYDSAKQVDSHRDAKLRDLKQIIAKKVTSPINKRNKKIIIFTAFADTAQYLYENLSESIKQKFGLYSALITGGGGQKTNLPGVKVTDMNDVLVNFSPISKERKRINAQADKDIDILIATDAISEGQNLQDADYLINYDIHWNPVRVIQRFGRIDRIGSQNTQIQLVNFWPNMDLDEYINLENRVRSRMVLMNTTATGEDDVLNVNSKSQKEMNDLQYRRNQLKQLQDEVLNLEDVNGAISITDVTFSDFKADLSNALKENQVGLESSPKGMFAITKASLINEAEPGIIFVLKSKEKREDEYRNSLSPYVIIYMKKNGETKIDHTHAQQVFSLFKKLCKDQKGIFPELVKKFNAKTNKGKNMENYALLLQSAIEKINGKDEENGIQSLFSPGGTNIQPSNDNVDDFELISFLIVAGDSDGNE